jgi:hypothetical protein
VIARATRARAAAACFALAVGLAHGRLGASAPPGQYEEYASTDTCITDHYTRLVWRRAPISEKVPLSGAVPSCESLGAGWRVPTMQELATLVDEDAHAEGAVTKVIDAQAFPGTPVDAPYWTATTPGVTVDFATGAVGTASPGAMLYLRCVVFAPASKPAACQ